MRFFDFLLSLLLLGLSCSPLFAVEILVEPAPLSLPTAWKEFSNRGVQGSPRLGEENFSRLRCLVAVRGGKGQSSLLGARRVRWAEGRFELAFSSPSQGGKAQVLAFDSLESSWEVVATIPSPGGGEPRIYLSDRDPLVAFTVDFGQWDTCPEVRWLQDEGVEVLPLPCPEAGLQAMRALRRSGRSGQNASLGQLQLRLQNLRWVKPSFFLEGGVDLEAELRWKVGSEVEVFPASLRLEAGRITACQLLPRE